MERIKKLDSAAIEMINEAISEIRHYTDPKQKDRKNWKGIALNAVSVLLNLPYATSLVMSSEDMKLWAKICRPFRPFAEKSEFSWSEIRPFIEAVSPLLEKYGFKSGFTLIKKEPASKRYTSEATNNAVANVYLYTLWQKSPQRLKKLCPKIRAIDSAMRKLAMDGLWHLSSLGNDRNYDELLTLEEGLSLKAPIHFNWTRMVILLSRCKIDYIDPLQWIGQHKAYNPITKRKKAA